MNIELSRRRALVCGSSQGIGRAVAIELAALGAEVVLLARDRERLEGVRKGLAANGGQAHRILVADFGRPEAVRSAVAGLLAESGPIHILINNTGGPPPGPAGEAEPKAYLAAFTQHLVCNQVLVQSLVPGMTAAGYGRIINIISTSVRQPIKGLGVSNTIRGAVASWAKTLAGELGPFGITVNNVLPGSTRTGRLMAVLESRAQARGMDLAEIESEERAAIPLGRFAEPEELAAAVAFLASPAAGYINGVSLPVDGGRTQCL
jgi:3-oxoacyl-[acyl-carrier protein] reductase